jgi:hypothetical protein
LTVIRSRPKPSRVEAARDALMARPSKDDSPESR